MFTLMHHSPFFVGSLVNNALCSLNFFERLNFYGQRKGELLSVERPSPRRATHIPTKR